MIRVAISAFVLLWVFSSARAADGASCAVRPDAKAFNRCRVCHSVSADPGHLSGPNLWGVIGRAAGTAPGYVYSDAVKSSGVVWSASNIREYVEDPSGFLPGTRMMSTPMKNAVAVDEIVCYLQSTGAVPEKPSVAVNDNITRWARGSYDYLNIEDGAKRGWERFEMMVHPDGSRTMLMWHDLSARNAQFSVVLRSEASFRPQEVYLNYWVDGGHKGSALLRVDGDKLQVDSRGSGGRHSETVAVPAEFSIGTHPIAGDGWHLYQMPGADDQVAKIYIMEASDDLSRPLLGNFVDMPFENVGAEQVTTPAGTFSTLHYRLAGRFDVWITGEDRLMVKMCNEPRGFEYLLRSFESSEASIH